MIETLEWRSDQTASLTVTVPKGFVTDLASVPRIFWSALPPAARYSYPSIIHDYLYWFQPCERSTADDITAPKMTPRVADSLRSLYINVTLGTDLTYDETCRIVDTFMETVNLPSTTVSIFYYSGHGMQISDQNYIVPTDFDQYADENVTKLLNVQSIIDRMSSASAVRIVILDACRNNADARYFVSGKGISSEKAFFIDNNPLPASGLAEMKASGSNLTFGARV